MPFACACAVIIPSYIELPPLLAIGCPPSRLSNLRKFSLDTVCATAPGRPKTAATKNEKRKTRIHAPIWPTYSRRYPLRLAAVQTGLGVDGLVLREQRFVGW